MIFMAANWIPKRLVDISLINVAAKTGAYFVEVCETEYKNRISAAVRAILKSQRHIVMLTGPSSSGKTTTAYRLCEELGRCGSTAQVISLDDFFLDMKDYPLLPDGTPDYENVTALDIPLINRCLAEVAETGKTMVPQYDFLTQQRMAAYRSVEIGDGVLIIEGIHAHNPMLVELLPQDKVYKVYAGLREEYSYMGKRVLPTRDVRLARRMVRDCKFRGHSPLKTLEMWPGVCHGEDLYIKVFKPHADYILDTSFSYEIECLAPQVLELAEKFCDGTEKTKKLEQLAQWFRLCEEPMSQYVPQDSMLMEFLAKP